MSCSTTAAESAPVTQAAQNKSMTYKEMRKIYASLPKSLPRPTRTVECNMMSYTDGKGTKKQIWMPKGTTRTACKHLEKEDWDALVKFPVWGGFTFSFCERL